MTLPVPQLPLTPAEVGGLLGLSRPFVEGLLDDGAIPAELAPDGRVVPLAGVLDFQARRDRRRTGRRAVADTIHDAGLPY